MSIIAIVGRPNVGKSTLFNRLVGQRDAIVDPTSGVTRDRHYGKSDWNGVEFSVIDTGGFVNDSEDVFEEEIKKQIQTAIQESDILLFMVDAKDGLTSMDEELAMELRKSQKPTFLIANKVDSHKLIHDVNEFYKLGLGNLYPISAINGSGTGDLLDDVVAEIPSEEQKSADEQELNDQKPEPELPKIAIVGRPNAGKSSLVNVLLGNERTIVTPIPGTTRDSIDTRYTSFGFDFLLIDTAGIRKKGKVSENVEFYAVMRAIRSIESCDVCILMVDAERGFESQDQNIFHLIQKNHKGVVILVNKWDLISKEHNTHKQFEQAIRDKIAPFRDVPVIFTSVTEKQRIFKAVETAIDVFKRREQRISTSQLNEILLPVIQQMPPPKVRDKAIKIKYITQLPIRYPSFVFFCNYPQYIKEPYRRFIENQIREHFQFTGVPVTIWFRQK